MRTITVAAWRHYLRRSAATMLAVFLGVGFCVATLTLTAAARQGAGDAVAVQYSAADVIAFVPAGSAQSAAIQISRLPGVAAADAVQTVSVDFPGSAGAGLGFETVAEVPRSSSLRWMSLDSGRWPQGADEVALDASTASAARLSIGSTISASMDGTGTTATRSVRVVGIVAHHKGAQGAATVFTAAGALSSWQVPGTEGEVDVDAAGGVSASTLVGRVDGRFPGIEVATAAQLRANAVSSLTDDVDVLGLFLEGFAAISLFVAGLVVANTLRIVMVQRAREFALLRCVGAQRGQVVLLVLGEALLLGATGAVAGLVAGLGVAGVMVAVLNSTSVPVPFAFVLPSASQLALPLLGGLVVTALAAASPAVHAGRLAPVEALRPAGMETPVIGRGANPLRLAAGVLVGFFGCLVMAVGARSGRLPIGLLGGLVSFIGVLALCPLLVPLTVRLLSAARRLLPRRLRGGVPASFAALHATRHPRRTAAAAGALLVGVTLISTLMVGAASVSATETQALDRVTPVDLTVSGSQVPASLVDRIRQLDGVADVVLLRGSRIAVGSRHVDVASISAGDATSVVRDSGLRAILAQPGTLVVPAGDGFELPGGGSTPVTLKTVGGGSVRLTPVLSSISGGPMLVSSSTLASLGDAHLPLGLYLRADESADPSALAAAVQQTIRQAGAGEHAGVSGGFVKRSTYDNAVTVMLAIATAMLAVAVLIALVGVGNTLGLSVLERTREHGLLRALGLTTTQLRLMLAHEGLLMAAAAGILGSLLGVVYGWAGTLTLLHGTVSTGPTLAVPWLRLVGIVAVALAAGVVAALMPARRAVRVAPTEALAQA